MSKPVILTGLRANNDLHLGNYLGAIRSVVALQKHHAGEYQVNMFVPDLHSFTTPIDHGKLYQQTLENIKLFVAAGLDVDDPNTFVYRQSAIPAHSEMTWILSCFTYYGELRRMTQFKEKAKQHKVEGESVLDNTDTPEATEDLAQHMTAGLFIYPVLMAADILLYDTKYVPVGEDQSQHVELARDVAVRMNNKFGKLFDLPEVYGTYNHTSEGKDPVRLRIRDLVNPEKKMSKSDASGKGVIFLTESPASAAKKIMSATTDSDNKIVYDMEKKPGISNLIQIAASLRGVSTEGVCREYKDQKQYGPFKQAVADEVEKFLTLFQEKLAAVDEKALLQKLGTGEAAMNKTANAKLLLVQKAVGLRP
jgi:tryptophanyl-tRNA synthetase